MRDGFLDGGEGVGPGHWYLQPAGGALAASVLVGRIWALLVPGVVMTPTGTLSNSHTHAGTECLVHVDVTGVRYGVDGLRRRRPLVRE
jgi:hypothetical protein